MKKNLFLVVAILMVMNILAGCTQPGSPSPSSSGTVSPPASSGAAPSSRPAEKIKMNISCLNGGSNQDYADELQILVNDYNADNTYGIELTLEGYVNEQYKTKITTLMASNAQPDIFYTWEAGFMKPFVEGSKVYPVGDILQADAEWWGRFPDKSVFGPVTFADGKIYAVPNTRQITIITYNMEMFKDAGCEVPKTWDEFLAVCDKLKAKGYTPLSIPGSEAWYAGQFLQQLANGIGGDDLYEGICAGTATWDDPRFIEAGQMLQDLVNRGYLPAGYLGQTPTEAFEQLANGKIAMFYHITSGLNKIGDETAPTYGKLGFFRLPTNNAANAGLNVGSIGQPYAVSSKAESIEGACDFVKELSNTKWQTFLATKMGQIIVTDTSYDKSKVEPRALQCQPLFNEVTTYTPWFDRIFGAGEGVELNNAAVAIMSGTSPEEAMKGLQQFAIDNATR